MKYHKLLSILCCAFAITAGTVQAQTPTGQETVIDISEKSFPSEFESGKAPLPQVIETAGKKALQFIADATTQSSPVSVKGHTADFSKGILLKVSFRDEAEQNNEYPRLLDNKDISLQIVSRAPRKVKFMLYKSENEYAQVVSELPFLDEKQWHLAEAAYDPVKKKIYLQLDGGDCVEEDVDFTLKNTSARTLLIGGERLDDAKRVFNGCIGSISYTSPFSEAEKVMNLKALCDDTPGIEYRQVSRMKGRHLAFPGVTEAANKDLLVVFREGEAHVCPYGRICLTRSKDGGKNWSAPVSVADSESDERDPSIQTLPDGRLLLAYGGWNSWMSTEKTAMKYKSETEYIKQAGADKFGGSRYMFSNDNGFSWSQAVAAEAFCPHGPFFSGSKLYSPGLADEDGKRLVTFSEADANGKNWKRVSVIGRSEYASDAYKNVAVYEEPHCIELKDGSFLAAIRVPMPTDGYMRISRSEDKGKTWSEPVKTNVRGFPQHLLQLKDGRILASYGYRFKPMGIRACISKNGGKTWDTENEIIIRRGGLTGDLGYPVSIELEDGKVLTVYYYNSRDSKKECFIEAAIYKP